MKKGIASIVLVLLIGGGLLGGTALGYVFREPLKKIITGKNTAEEVEEAQAQKLGQGKFELEGITTQVDAASKIITVKIKSSTNSIKEMRLSETPITISDSANIIFGSKTDLTIADIPINAQVHVGGTIENGLLTATKIIIQKESVEKQKNDHFAVGGVVKQVLSDGLLVTIFSANKIAKDQIGKDLTIKVTSSTLIEKNNISISLSEAQVSDKIQVVGIVENNVFNASKIEVKVKVQAGELKEQNQNSNSVGTEPGKSKHKPE